MNWYKTAQNNTEIMNHPDFKGFHCQKNESQSKDKILKEYAESYFFDIIESIPFDLHNKMGQLGIDIYPPEDQYSEEFELWSEQVEDFLYKNGIRWIFVSSNNLFNDMRFNGGSYGNLCYYILIPNDIILYENIDVHEVNSYYIIYDSRKGVPTRIPIEEEDSNELV
jgi:hypothetical protein